MKEDHIDSSEILIINFNKFLRIHFVRMNYYDNINVIIYVYIDKNRISINPVINLSCNIG